MDEIREARPEDAQTLATVQECASVAALSHIVPPELYPPNPLDGGYTLDF